MGWAIAAAVIAGLSAIGSGIFGYYDRQQTNAQIEEANKRNEALQREAWDREDNAVQRRKADLEAAGLSPTLAAGSAAASSGPSIKIQHGESGLEELGQIMGAPTNALNAYLNTQNQISTNKINKANATIAKNEAEFSNDTIAQRKNAFTTEQAILNAQATSAATENDIQQYQRSILRNEYDRLPQKNKIQDLMIEQMEQDILNGDWDRALKISSHFAEMFKTGSEISAMSQRNQIMQQYLQNKQGANNK